MNTNMEPLDNNKSSLENKEFVPALKKPKKEEALLNPSRIAKKSEVKEHRIAITPADQIIANTNKQILDNTHEMLQRVQQNPSKRMRENQSKNLTPDPKFICDEETYKKLLFEFQKQINSTASFDTLVFLSGIKEEIPEKILKSNQDILDDSMSFLRRQAHELVNEKSTTEIPFSLEEAYKLLIGF